MPASELEQRVGELESTIRAPLQTKRQTITDSLSDKTVAEIRAFGNAATSNYFSESDRLKKADLITKVGDAIPNHRLDKANDVLADGTWDNRWADQTR